PVPVIRQWVSSQPAALGIGRSATLSNPRIGLSDGSFGLMEPQAEETRSERALRVAKKKEKVEKAFVEYQRRSFLSPCAASEKKQKKLTVRALAKELLVNYMALNTRVQGWKREQDLEANLNLATDSFDSMSVSEPMQLATGSIDSRALQAPPRTLPIVTPPTSTIYISNDDGVAGEDDTVNRSFDSRSSTQSPPQKKQRKKKPFSELSDRALRDAVYDMGMVVALTGLAQSLLDKDGRPSTSSEVAAVLAYAAGHSANTATNSRGAIKLLKHLGDKQASLPIRELCATALVQDLGRSLASARLKSVDRMRALSSLAFDFNMGQINNFILHLSAEDVRAVTRGEYRVAKLNNRIYGAGNVGVVKRVVVRRWLFVDEQGEGLAEHVHALRFCIEFCSSYLSHQSYGTRSIKLSYGVELTIPRIEPTVNKATVVDEYMTAVKQQHQQCSQYVQLQNADPEYEEDEGLEQPVIGLCHAHVRTVVATLTGGKANANLAALDSVYVKCCIENGERTRFLIEVITVDRPDLRAELGRDQEKVQNFLHKLYADHLFPDSPCAAHSFKYAFGDVGEEEEKDQFCADCLAIDLFKQDVLKAIRSAVVAPPESRGELEHFFVSVLCDELDRYRGHIVRKSHELLLEQLIIEHLIDPSRGVLVRSDYKMKMLSLVYREGMTAFFGKRGFSWCGFSFCRYKTQEERQKEVDDKRPFISEVVVTFVDSICDDGTEDCFAVT
ncbi:hypothetical protein B484DRAFT_236579, partial [Ochromonadaceae sp. CCMP2298]